MPRQFLNRHVRLSTWPSARPAQDLVKYLRIPLALPQLRSVEELWLQPHCPLLKPIQLADGPVIYPFVTVEVLGGGSFACARAEDEPCINGGSWESTTVEGNGFDPDWGGQSVELLTSHPDLTLLRIGLHSERQSSFP